MVVNFLFIFQQGAKGGPQRASQVRKSDMSSLPKMKFGKERLKEAKSPIVTRRRSHREVDKNREAARNIYNWFVYRWNVLPSLREQQGNLFKGTVLIHADQ